MKIKSTITVGVVIFIASSLCHAQKASALSTVGASMTLSDNDPDKLLAAGSAKAKSLQALSADIELSWQTPGQPLKKHVGSMTLMKPNYALMKLKGDYPLIALASDGQSLYAMPDLTKYTLSATEPHGQNIDNPWWALPVRFFFTQNVKPYGPDSPSWISSRFVGIETLGNERYSVIEIAGDKPSEYSVRLYFDQKMLLRRSIVTFSKGARGAAVFKAKIENVRILKRLPIVKFKFRPPLSATFDTGAESRMLALGDTGPGFSLPTPEGDILKLADLRRGKKATLITFWYVACPPCREEFRLFQTLYSELKDRGLALVAINKIDDKEEIKAFVRSSSILFPIVMAERGSPGVMSSYRIEAYPSTYLLDANGKIVFRAVGVNETGLLKALGDLSLRR